MHYMKTFYLPKFASAVLEYLATQKRIDNGGGFMAVCIERLSPKRIAIAHYFEQNGDLVQDPEMVFLRSDDGNWMPVSIQHPYMPVMDALELGDDEQITGYRKGLVRELKSFGAWWRANIVRQQGLKLTVPEE